MQQEEGPGKKEEKTITLQNTYTSNYQTKVFFFASKPVQKWLNPSNSPQVLFPSDAVDERILAHQQ